VTTDPTTHAVWAPLWALQAAMDADIARLYTDAHIEGLKPSFVKELLTAESVQLTHSAVSQKVAAMRTAGWVRTAAGADARSKKVALTAKARRIVARLAAEWRATEAAVAEIEAELPYPMTKVVRDIEEALRRKSFHDRIAKKLAEDPTWA
jgi:DNA-binding MarR family transcriptional regulator